MMAGKKVFHEGKEIRILISGDMLGLLDGVKTEKNRTRSQIIRDILEGYFESDKDRLKSIENQLKKINAQLKKRR